MLQNILRSFAEHQGGKKTNEYVYQSNIMTKNTDSILRDTSTPTSVKLSLQIFYMHL